MKQTISRGTPNLKQKLSKIFPIKPYTTQLEIATSLYELLEGREKKAVIVESPTGTGKTYALLVGTIAWMLDNPNQLQLPKNQANQNEQEQNSVPSWLIQKNKEHKLQKLRRKQKEKLQKLIQMEQYKKKKNQSGKKYKDKVSDKSEENNKLSWEIKDIEDLTFFKDTQSGKKRQLNSMNLEGFANEDLLKIIFVSRTHSQLSQVMDSIKNLNIEVRSISLASKDHLCVHPRMQKSKVHQKCQYLMSHGGCPYYHQESISNFFGLNIQQSLKIGEQNLVCAYYGVKNLTGISDVICVPYATILSQQIRQKLNINIKNSIIIFDEAHNILDQQTGLRSPQISYNELESLCRRIDQYIEKYGNKMMAENKSLIQHMQQICRSLMNVLKIQYQRSLKIQKVQRQNYLGQFEKEEVDWQNRQENDFTKRQRGTNYTTMSKIQLFAKLKLSQIRISQLKGYISLSNFDNKLVYFNTKQPFSASVINNFLNFLTQITTCSFGESLESTIIIAKNLPIIPNQTLKDSSLRIFCFESKEVAKICNQARLVILAGGTMEPVSPYINIFTGSFIDYQIIKGQHVIKKQQCKVFCISGINAEGKKEKIKINYSLMKINWQRILSNACLIIQSIFFMKTKKGEGIVLFIQSYQVLQLIRQIIKKFLKDVEIFFDSPQTKEEQNVFAKYYKRIKEDKQSAILVSVMGGKLSQGINFSDQLARSIIVLGLPYPNIKSPEISEKMKYLDLKIRKKAESGQITFQSAKQVQRQSIKHKQSLACQDTGYSFYQNCCIKTLNQTIGRGIRHINDYASIYLIDLRFGAMSKKLPEWMQKSIKYIEYYDC